MKLTYLLAAALTLSSAICMLSCRREGRNTVAISQNNDRRSHNNGALCQNCHKKGGDGAGAGWFVVAGSGFLPDLITPNANGRIVLYKGQNGTGQAVATIPVDALGNFYSTESIDFANGLYPAFEGAGGTVKYMGQVTRVGSCNGCHGVTTDRLWAD